MERDVRVHACVRACVSHSMGEARLVWSPEVAAALSGERRVHGLVVDGRGVEAAGWPIEVAKEAPQFARIMAGNVYKHFDLPQGFRS